MTTTTDRRARLARLKLARRVARLLRDDSRPDLKGATTPGLAEYCAMNERRARGA
jgi:hypothetical protein